MSKFTGGEWKYLEALGGVTAYPKGEGKTFPDGARWQDITGELMGLDDEEVDANGRLIAAAPEMYELLEALLNEYNAYVKSYPGLRRRILELLARINGEEANNA